MSESDDSGSYQCVLPIYNTPASILQLQLFSPSPRQSDVCTTKKEADENEVITSYVSEPVGVVSI